MKEHSLFSDGLSTLNSIGSACAAIFLSTKPFRIFVNRAPFPATTFRGSLSNISDKMADESSLENQH